MSWTPTPSSREFGSTSVADLIYLALGDSYSAGTGASSAERAFPSQLAVRLAGATGVGLEAINLGVDGATAEDLIRSQLPQAEHLRPDLVTLLIGVNDICQGVTPDRYEAALEQIHARIEAFTRPPKRVVCIEIPDYTVTPAGPDYGDVGDQSARINQFNSIAARLAGRRDWPLVRIADLSRTRLSEPGWISGDGLHPGDVQYAAWTEAIWDQCPNTWADLVATATSSAG